MREREIEREKERERDRARESVCVRERERARAQGREARTAATGAGDEERLRGARREIQRQVPARPWFTFQFFYSCISVFLWCFCSYISVFLQLYFSFSLVTFQFIYSHISVFLLSSQFAFSISLYSNFSVEFVPERSLPGLVFCRLGTKSTRPILEPRLYPSCIVLQKLCLTPAVIEFRLIHSLPRVSHTDQPGCSLEAKSSQAGTDPESNIAE